MFILHALDANSEGVLLEEPKDKKSKKRKVVEDQSNSTSPSRSVTPEIPVVKKIVIPVKPCLMCKRLEPRDSLAQCQKCTLSAHSACYGIPEDTVLENWNCELCQLEHQPQPKVFPTWPTFDMDPEQRLLKPLRSLEDLSCPLCPEMELPDVPKEKETLSALDILKPTDSNL
jgi:hypothetical protein